MAAHAVFDVAVDEARSGYSVRLLEAFGVGDLPPQAVEISLDVDALPQNRDDVAAWMQATLALQPSGAGEAFAHARELGCLLFEQLFTAELRMTLRESRRALPPDQLLRVQLRLPPSLAPLPWELLYDRQAQQFLALAPDLVLVRYPELSIPLQPRDLDGPLQILFVAASPTDLPPLEIDRELERLGQALQAPLAQNRVAMSVIRGPDTLGQLQARLRTPVHVVHYLGHGAFDSERDEGLLIFESADGSSESVNADLLRVQMQKQRGQTRLVVLNACLGALTGSNGSFNGVAAALLHAGVPAVLAMQFAITDEVAVDLTRVFYTELGRGAPVDVAVNETRMHLYGRNPYRLDWIIPVLFLRAVEGELFHRVAPSENAPAAISPPVPKEVEVPTRTPSRAPSAPTRSRRAGRRRGTWLVGFILLLALCALALALVNSLRSILPSESTPEISMLSPATDPATSTADQPAADGAANALPAPSFPTPEPTAQPVAATNISNTPGRSDSAQIGVDDDGAVHVLWLDNTPRQGAAETVLARARLPNGDWTEIQDLTPELEYVGFPWLAANLDRNLCLVLDSVTGTYSRCVNHGEWSPVTTLAESKTRNVFAPALDGEPQIRWIAGLNEVTYGDEKLDDGLANPSQAAFAIDAQNGFHVVWRRAGGDKWSIEVRASSDAGASWQIQERLTSPDAVFPSSPVLAADPDGAVHLVWSEHGTTNYRRWSEPGGWSDAVSIGRRGGSDIDLAVTDAGLPEVVWVNDCMVYHTAQGEGGTWSEPWVLNADASPSNCADEVEIAVDAGGETHVAWVAPGNDGQRDLFFVTLP